MKITTKQEFQNALKVSNKIDCFDRDILGLSQKSIKNIIDYINEYEDTHDLIIKYKKRHVIIEIVFNQDDCIDIWMQSLKEYENIVGKDKLDEMFIEQLGIERS